MTELTTLANGLRVVTREMPGLETAAVGLFAGAGSRDEPAEHNGLAHLFEHMLFKGAGERSARQLNEAIEDVGGELNACTERDVTSFTASVLAEHVPLSVGLIADMVLRPHFSDAELAREKDVVLQELAEARDTPGDLVFEELWAAAYADQPLGRSVLGDESSLARIDVDSLRGWQASRYPAGNLVLAAAGKVDHSAVVALAEEHFAELPTGAKEDGPRARFTAGARRVRGRSGQAHLTLAFEAPGLFADDMLAARLFADIVGGGASSRLFHELREERGLAYSVSASVSAYADTGILSLYAATSSDQALAALELIEQLIRAAAADATEGELSRARMQARAGLLHASETSAGFMHIIGGRTIIHGRPVPIAETLAKLDAVTLADVRAAGAKIVAGPIARASIGVPAARAA
jgi:predicted Zn-dependent peptidase